ncbi:MAG: energy transducer TonB [Bacteroidota bacterium]
MRALAPEQRLLRLLGLSVVLHGLLFAGLSWQRPSRPPAISPIFASLRQNLAPDAGTSAEKPRPAVRAALPPQARPPLSTAAHRPVPQLTRAAGPATVAAPSPAAELSTSAAPSSAAAPASDIVSPSPAPVAAKAVASRPQGELLAAYRQRLGELFARHQEYPRIAALRGWEGEVRLRLRVARKGNLLAVQLDHSSGFDILDQHALAMLEQMASLPPLPDGLEASEILVVVPVNYKLKKTT